MTQTVVLDAGETTTVAAESGATPPHAQGTLIGRYVVIEPLASGGMGAVFRVYDPELDREVALKRLLVPRGTDETKGGIDRRARMLREAQALAQLSHPNVVQVFDVGTIGDDLYIAMELIQGETLQQWVQRGHPWRRVVEAFIGAGRGLVAAHQRGIVHRDFKLANVLYGADGRARVVDFGLARDLSDSTPSGTQTSTRTQDRVMAMAQERLGHQLTADGMVIGTPKTMAPEQHAGRPADEQADQFSFCVALFEGLWGAAPFAAGSMWDLAVKKLERRVDVPPGTVVPARVRRAVLRGLAPLPSDRWASMEDLLAELEAAVRPPRRWLPLGAAGLAAALVLWGVGSDPCPRRDQLQTRWNPETKQLSRTAFGQFPLGPDTWQRTEAIVDVWARGWSKAYDSACAQGGDALSDRRYACLQDRASELGALVEIFGSADAAVVEHAVEAGLSLPTPDQCVDPTVLGALVRPPGDPAVRAAAQDVRTTLTEAAALQLAGRYERASAMSAAAVERAEELGYAPLLAEAYLRHGELQALRSELEAGRKTLGEAYSTASQAGYDAVALQAATALVRVEGVDLADVRAGSEWVRFAESLLQRATPPPGLTATLLDHQGQLFEVQGDYAQALVRHREALRLRETELGPTHPDVARSLNRIGDLLHRLGHFDDSIAHLRMALSVREHALGPDHPAVAESLASLANELYTGGKGEEAIAVAKRALDVRRRTLGAEHRLVASSLNLLARGYGLVGEFEDALGVEREALEILERTLGPDHLDVASTLGSMGLVLHKLDRFDEALEVQTRCLRIRESTLGPDHPHVAMSLVNIGFIHEATRRFEEELATLRRAAQIFRRALGPDHILLAYVLTGMGNALRETGRTDEAVLALEEAVDIGTRGESDFLALGQARFALARALWSAGDDPPRARAEANAARVELRDAGEPGKDLIAEIDAWLDARID